MVICKAEINDAQKMLNMMLELDKETKYMLFEPNERSKNINIIENMIQKGINGDNLILLAKEKEDIVGFLAAERGTLKRIKHSAYIVVGIRESFCGKGIGQTFFQQLDDWAIKNSIIRLELTVMSCNVIAKKLYEKNGFEVEGKKIKSMFVDGEYIDEYYMSKIYTNYGVE